MLTGSPEAASSGSTMVDSTGSSNTSSLSIDVSKDRELSIKGLNTFCLAIALEQWQAQGVQNTRDGSDFVSGDAGDADDDSNSNPAISDPDSDLFADSLLIPVEIPPPAQFRVSVSSQTSSSLHTSSYLFTATLLLLVDSIAGSVRDSKGQRGWRYERSSRSVPVATGTIRRTARLTGKPTCTYLVEISQITATEKSDEDDGVECDFCC